MDFSEPKITIDLKEYQSLKNELQELKDREPLTREELSSAANCIVGCLLHKQNTYQVFDDFFKRTDIFISINSMPQIAEPMIIIEKRKRPTT